MTFRPAWSPALPIFLLFVLVVPSLVRAQVTTLHTEGGWAYDLDIQGAVRTGASGLGTHFVAPYNGCFKVTLNGLPYVGGTPVLSGSTVTYPDAVVGTLSLQRIVYVPTSGGDFIRYFDLITNPGSSPATVNVSYTCPLSSLGIWSVDASSSGDATFTADDDWFTTNNMLQHESVLGFVLQGQHAAAHVSTVTFDPSSPDQVTWSFDVTIHAGGHAGLVTFGTQKADTDAAGARAEAAQLAKAPDSAMVGLDGYFDSIVNFLEDVPGAPKIRFTGPVDAAEGAAIDMSVSIIDVGGPSTFSWDLDGDGTFGDMPGVTTYSIPAGTTDGPSTLRFGVEATNATATSQRYRDVSIINVPPMLVPPFPSVLTANGSRYNHQFMASDPGGAHDPPNFTCTHCPVAMTISPTGLLEWVPSSLDVTKPSMPDHVVVTVDDGDGGSATHAWDLTVLADHQPSRPLIAYPSGIVVDGIPRLAAGNSSDLDDDPLSYFFELDTVSTFDSSAKQASPAVAQTDGFTAWRPGAALDTGTQYFWRVKANDSTIDSEWAMASFYTSGTPPQHDMGVSDADSTLDGNADTDAGYDAGGGGDHRGGCCTVAVTAGGGGTGVAALGAAALLVIRRRRR